MTQIRASVERYETWLRERLGDEVVEAGLARKHERMRASAFSFLRATYWRWAETVHETCADAMGAAHVLSVGDTHLENLGTWRDGDARLVWGVNDFDEAAVMPWPLDIVRLAASAVLVHDAGPKAAICDAIWKGYQEGLAAPAPVTLERDHRWLREAVLLPEKDRAKWWAKLTGSAQDVGECYRAALVAALPESTEDVSIFARAAGTGSLGRPRFVAIGTWRGGPVVRECKAILPSAWCVFGQGTPCPIRAAEIAGAGTRAADPSYQVADGLVTRRLSPNSRKIEVDDAGGVLSSPDMLKLMGREIACCHAGDVAYLAAVQADAAGRDARWLESLASSAAAGVRRDHKQFS